MRFVEVVLVIVFNLKKIPKALWFIIPTSYDLFLYNSKII